MRICFAGSYAVLTPIIKQETKKHNLKGSPFHHLDTFQRTKIMQVFTHMLVVSHNTIFHVFFSEQWPILYLIIETYISTLFFDSLH